MADPLQPHLDRIANTKAAEDAIHRAFFDDAKRYADQLLSQGVRRTVGPSAIANAAIHSAIRQARRAAEAIPETAFRGLVFTITMRKAAAAGRAMTTQGRDVTRTESLADDPPASRAELAPAERLAAHEVAEAVTAWILAEPDDTRRLVRFFGVIHEEKPADIHALLQGLSQTHPQMGFRVPAVRTIQLELQSTYERIREQFDTP